MTTATEVIEAKEADSEKVDSEKVDSEIEKVDSEIEKADSEEDAEEVIEIEKENMNQTTPSSGETLTIDYSVFDHL